MSLRNKTGAESDKMMLLVHEFSLTHADGPFTMHDVARWAFAENKWHPAISVAEKDLAKRLSIAAKRSRHTDPQGRRVRKLHAARYPVMKPGGQMVFETMWDYIELMSVEHARMSFEQRQSQIEGACRSLQRDASSFNDNNPRAANNPICTFRQLVMFGVG